MAISSAGDRVVANYGNTHTDHNYRLDLIDLAHATTKSLGDLSRPAWSPDGMWVAAIEWSRERLILLDTSDFSHRRHLGPTFETAWSPDSKYLLVWKYHFLKCGFGFDVPPAASFEVVAVESGKRSLIRSSQCQLVGVSDWMNRQRYSKMIDLAACARTGPGRIRSLDRQSVRASERPASEKSRSSSAPSAFRQISQKL